VNVLFHILVFALMMLVGGRPPFNELLAQFGGDAGAAAGGGSAARLTAAALKVCTATRARSKASFEPGPAASSPASTWAICAAALPGPELALR
jgi:hypothetical protein